MNTPESPATHDALVKAASAIRDAFNYDPGHSDLDNEQPIHISTTLGAWRRLNHALCFPKHAAELDANGTRSETALIDRALLAVEAKQAEYREDTIGGAMIRGALEQVMASIRALKNAAPQEALAGDVDSGSRPAVAALVAAQQEPDEDLRRAAATAAADTGAPSAVAGIDAEAITWALGKLEAFGLQTKTENALMMDRLKLMVLDSSAPPAAAAPKLAGHDLVDWLKSWWSLDEMWRDSQRKLYGPDVAHLMRGVADMIERCPPPAAARTVYQAPSGFKLLPKQPTNEMILAIEKHYTKWQNIVGGADDEVKADCWTALQVYRAMYDAAPISESVESATEEKKS